MSFLADTCLISDVRRSLAGPTAWMASTPMSQLFISAITVGELRRGVVKLMRRDPEGAARLDAFLNGLRATYATRLLPVSEEVACKWGELTARRSRPLADALIAATALVHGLAVVTRNVADFADTGVVVVNPWEGA